MASNSDLIQVSEDLSPYGDPLVQYEGSNSLLEIWTEEAEACTHQNPLTRPQKVVKSCSLVLNNRALEAAWPLFYTQRAIAYHRLHRPQNMRATRRLRGLGHRSTCSKMWRIGFGQPNFGTSTARPWMP